MKILDALTDFNKPALIASGFMLVGLVGFLDYVTGNELGFSLFYALPIALTTWFVSKRFGTATAVLSACVWLAADIGAGRSHSHPALYVWNTLMRYGFFIVIVTLLSALRRSLEHQKELARTDPLTGAVNSRHFQELLYNEVVRSKRYSHPLTLVYLDVDDFKDLNDRFGHATGDEALRVIVRQFKDSLRSIDVIARMGGDEFAILLPETDQPAARSVVSKLQERLLQAMQLHDWHVTFSFGVLSCGDAEFPPDQMLSVADRLMYTVKSKGKNSAIYVSWREPSVPARMDETIEKVV